MRCRGMMSIEEMREFLISAEPLEFQGVTREEKYRWVEETLTRHKYLKLTKREKGIVRAYLRKMTGFSPSQLTRLISGYRWTGTVKVTPYRRDRFPRRYTPEDIRLLAEVDEVNERLSGPATRQILKRAHEVFGKGEYQRVKGISVSHLYNLRKTRSYLRQTTFFQKTKPTSVNFMKDMATLGIRQIFTSYDNPKGNADTERMMRTIKEEVIWLHEFETLEEARDRIGNWIEVDYNKLSVHSELGYWSPGSLRLSITRRS